MKLSLGDVIRVKEDMQFHHPIAWEAIVGSVFKVTTIINDDSVLVQKCTENGAVTHARTKRVRNPDLSIFEFSDYYELLSFDPAAAWDIPVEPPMASDQTITDLLERISGQKGFHIGSDGVVYGQSWKTSPDNPTIYAYTDPEGENSEWQIPPWQASPFDAGPDEDVPTGEVVSDGGSSSYYDVDLPDWLVEKILTRKEDGNAYVKTEELIEVAFGNDFDFGNLFKSLVRAMGKKKGAGKAGNTLEYECNKMHYSTDKIKTLGSREEV